MVTPLIGSTSSMLSTSSPQKLCAADCRHKQGKCLRCRLSRENSPGSNQCRYGRKDCLQAGAGTHCDCNFSLLHVDDIIIEIGRISHAVDARYGRYHYHILASGKQGGSGGKPELVDFIVYGEVFLYICVRRRKIGFGLIVIIIGYIVFYRVVREKSLELAV